MPASTELNGNLKDRMSTVAFALRGYDVTNLGRSPELLAHPVYGSTFEGHLREASAIAADALSQPVDLVTRVRERRDTSLDCYGEAIALIAAVELAHLKLLEEHFGISFKDAKLAAGYSLGEVGSLVAAGVYPLESVLAPLVRLSYDTAELARDTRMGIVFSRGPELNIQAIEERCLRLSSEGRGMIAISSYLSPNTVLLMGQADTVIRFKRTIKEVFPTWVHMRINQDYWPPIHTPIVRQRSIPDRGAVMLTTVEGGFRTPSLPIISCVTGGEHYNEYNSRKLLIRWVDEPQRLWDVVAELFGRGIETVVHVGPSPNIIPATLNRLANNIATQLNSRSLAGLGLRAMSRIVRRHRPWLTSLLSQNATLLRAPFIEQIILEDWLLEHAPPHAGSDSPAAAEDQTPPVGSASKTSG